MFAFLFSWLLVMTDIAGSIVHFITR